MILGVQYIVPDFSDVFSKSSMSDIDTGVGNDRDGTPFHPGPAEAGQDADAVGAGRGGQRSPLSRTPAHLI